jgi:hypothetical protein
MKNQPMLLLLMKQSTSFFPLHNKKTIFPFQDFDDTLFLDSKSEEEMESPNGVNILCCTLEDKGAINEDETITHAENAKILKAPAQEEIVSYLPPQNFDNFMLYDLEEEIDEHMSVLNLPCYDTDTDTYNIDEFICVRRRRWDIVGYDMDPIYDIESHFQVLPLELSQQVTLDQWQQGDEIFTRFLQTPRMT